VNVNEQFTSTDPLLTKEQIATDGQVSVFAVDSWLSKGWLKKTKVGSLTRVRLSDWLAFQKRSTERAVDHPLARKSRQERATQKGRGKHVSKVEA
jgi:hypothetical protein